MQIIAFGFAIGVQQLSPEWSAAIGFSISLVGVAIWIWPWLVRDSRRTLGMFVLIGAVLFHPLLISYGPDGPPKIASDSSETTEGPESQSVAEAFRNDESLRESEIFTLWKGSSGGVVREICDSERLCVRLQSTEPELEDNAWWLPFYISGDMGQQHFDSGGFSYSLKVEADRVLRVAFSEIEVVLVVLSDNANDARIGFGFGDTYRPELEDAFAFGERAGVYEFDPADTSD